MATRKEEDPLRNAAVLVSCMAGRENKFGLEISREHAATILWQMAISKSSALDELSKTNYTEIAARLLESGSPGCQHVAAGLLAQMCRDEEFSNLTNLLQRSSTRNRVIGAIERILDPYWQHARSKNTAASLLEAMTGSPQILKLLPLVPSILKLLNCHEPQWSNIAAARESGAMALCRILRATHTAVAAKSGALSAILPHLLTPSAARTLFQNASHGNATLTSKSAACLEIAARHWSPLELMLPPEDLQACLRLLLVSEDERCAHLLGLLWHVSVLKNQNEALVEGRACHIVSRVLVQTVEKACAGKKKKGRSSSKKAPSLGGVLPPFADGILCHATGVLHQLSFSDACKKELAEAGVAPALLTARTSKNLQTYENATGALWNMGLEVACTEQMEAASAPVCLSHPVPHSWLTSGSHIKSGGLLSGEGLPAFHPTWDVAMHDN